jgi:AGCS family alanine or glycine:cation symporter
MWVVAFLGASTAYVESALGQIYKEVDEGQYRGGPAFYIEKAMGQKWYGWLFAIVTIIATGLLLPGVQANSITSAAELALGSGEIYQTAVGALSFTKIATTAFVVATLGFIIFGGVKRIAHVTQVVVPFMALAYIAAAIVIIALNLSELPRIFGMIIGDAFTPMAGLGAAIGWGVKRGVCLRSGAPCAAGAGTGIFRVRGHPVRLLCNGLHDPDYRCLQRSWR